MRSKWWTAAAFSVALFAAGCTPEARQDVSQAGEKMGQATEKSAQGTAEAMKKAGEKMETGAEKAAQATKEGAQQVGEAVGGAAKPMQMTPKVKGALVADKQIDASTLNVDTDVNTKTVTIKGTQATAQKKALVTQVAAKAVKEADPSYKVVNQVTVAPPKS
jgi:hypothetical protein